MTKATHTPGPWAYTPTNTERVSHFIRAADGFSVALVTPMQDGTESVAHLIAAAPDLLEALEAATTALEWARHHLNEAGVKSAQVHGTIPEARAAIAKAKGEA